MTYKIQSYLTLNVYLLKVVYRTKCPNFMTMTRQPLIKEQQTKKTPPRDIYLCAHGFHY